VVSRAGRHRRADREERDRMTLPTDVLTDAHIDRYSRQIILPEVGGRGQARLLAARVLLAGGDQAARSAATLLGRAGVGALDLLDGPAELPELSPDCRLARHAGGPVLPDAWVVVDHARPRRLPGARGRRARRERDARAPPRRRERRSEPASRRRRGHVRRARAAPRRRVCALRGHRVSPDVHPAYLKLEVAARGVILDPSVRARTALLRPTTGADAVARSLDLVLPDDVWVSAPVEERATAGSPFRLLADGERLFLARRNPDGAESLRIEIRAVPQPRFYERHTTRGTPMWRVAAV